jgi:cytochrome c
MTKLRLIQAIPLAFCSAILMGTAAVAQMQLPASKPPDGATLFKQQCATCHTIDPAEPSRAGPNLSKVMGRKAGKADGFHYSPRLAKADFVWDETKLDSWLTNPQAMISDAIMMYRQAKPETRSAIIAYLKGLN